MRIETGIHRGPTRNTRRQSVGAACLLACLPLCAIAGCGSRNANRAEISGRVTFDGNPLPEGSILLAPASGTSGPTAGGAITDGRYHIPAEKGPGLGTYRVEITAQRKTGRKKEVTSGPPLHQGVFEEAVQYIPPWYNRQSNLTVEIASGQNERDFELTSAPPK